MAGLAAGIDGDGQQPVQAGFQLVLRTIKELAEKFLPDTRPFCVRDMLCSKTVKERPKDKTLEIINVNVCVVWQKIREPKFNRTIGGRHTLQQRNRALPL